MPPPKLVPPKGKEVYELNSDEDFSLTGNGCRYVGLISLDYLSIMPTLALS
jgi:hypothetical protein